ncbi:MAG TPA: hypothetical protein VFC61_11135, partial [Blastocatellia bacterium]|nr:hypothetical protein [Blastocatellia bacterium]
EEISILPPLDPARPRVRPRPGVSGPNYRRTAEVYAVLAVAPPHLTYGQLIRRVRVATGRACSRKLVARWKRERRSLASPPQAAPPIAIAALTAVMLCHVSACSSVSRPAPSPAPTPSPSAIVVGADDSPAGPRGGGAPRHLKITLTVTSPSDLRVKAGDRVEAGAVLVDRGQERGRLAARRRLLRLSMQRLREQATLAGESLRLIGRLGASLPPASFAAEEAAIARAAIEAANVGRKTEVQRQRIAALPSVVPAGYDRDLIAAHERQRLSAAEGEERQAWAEVALARARGRAAKEARAAEDRRREIELARQTLEARGQKHQLEFAATQFEAQLAGVEEQLARLAEVRAPFGGRVERVQWEEQRDHQLTVSLYLTVGSADARR